MSYQGLQAETVSFRGYNGDQGEAYYARPVRPGKVPLILGVARTCSPSAPGIYIC